MINANNREVIERQATRAILLSPEREVLLMQIRNFDTKALFWICPGGGLESGEDHASGLTRELREELGLKIDGIGALVWKRHHTFPWRGRILSQREAFYLIELPRFEPVMSEADPKESESFEEFRWWKLHELEATHEAIAPKSLVRIVRDYLLHGPPKAELVVETLID